MTKQDIMQESLELHKKMKGKLSVKSKLPVTNKKELSLAYTPGVAQPCREIAAKTTDVYKYTNKGNFVAVVSDGTAVLGLGDIGPEAAMPVMEGKAVLFKEFGDVDAFPICIRTKDPDEIVKLVKQLEPTFGGINLEDISAPRCFEIEDRLKKELNIPVFHDDQHGTAIVVLAGLINALKVVNKNMQDLRIAMSGAGSAGIAVAKILLNAGAKEIIMCDSKGIIYSGREDMNPYKLLIAQQGNKKNEKGKLVDAIKGADVFIGVSKPGLVTKEIIQSMNNNAIIFAMSNPVPEIMPDIAKEAGAAVVATGRSDFPNQVNNVLAFPALFRGALDVNASDINEEMKLAAAEALANLVENPTADMILPEAFDPRIRTAVSSAVKKAAIESGVARSFD